MPTSISISTIVKRDASGNFIAGTITANLSGNATTATTVANNVNVSVISSSSTLFPYFGASGSSPLYSNASLTYVPSTGVLTATKLSSTSLSSNYINDNGAGVLTVGALSSDLKPNASTTYNLGTLTNKWYQLCTQNILDTGSSVTINNLANTTIGNVSSSAHGFCPILPRTLPAQYFLNGTGSWTYTPMAGRNLLINGIMSSNQKTGYNVSTGQSLSTAYYTADQWFVWQSLISLKFTPNVAASTLGGGLSQNINCLQLQCSTAGSLASTDFLVFAQRIEAQNLQVIQKGTSAAQPLTASFWMY